MDLLEQAEALYVLPLDRFTEARNTAAKQARREGANDLAAALQGLPKPAAAAWLVNVLVDRRRNEVEQVLELGASLREAQDSLDRAQLHALGQQRQRLLTAVARQSLDAAAELGQNVGTAALPGVEQTLRAALADPAAAAAVLTGRLVRTLEATGWDPVDLESAVAGPFTPPAAGEATAPDDGIPTDPGVAGPGRRTSEPTAVPAHRRKEADARLAAAQDARRAAEETAAGLQQKSRRLVVRRDGLTASIEDLEERLDALRREIADVDAEAAALDREAASADVVLAKATKAEEAASAQVRALNA
ncbi:hypothetical protein MN0502_08370 [Arthrobacter sp. MN05-02]|nr:hypothetical protein MN0502_08370 [Arthrobacter sp. MN05-02]